jgi:hypothetical protein
MLPKETYHGCDICKNFWHLLPGCETCSQTNLIRVVNLTCKKLEMRSFGLHINCWKCPSFLLHVHSSFSWQSRQSFKMQSTWAFDIRPPHLLLYLSLCFSASTHAQRTRVLFKCIQVSANYWEWKEWKLLHKWSFWAQKIVSMGTNWGPNSFAPEFWSKIEFGTPSTPLYFFVPVSSLIPYFGQTGGSHALFQQLYI